MFPISMAIVSMVSKECQISVNFGAIGMNGKGLSNVLQFAICNPRLTMPNLTQK